MTLKRWNGNENQKVVLTGDPKGATIICLDGWHVGDKVQFNHMGEGDPVFEISKLTTQTSDHSLMIELVELSGLFAPHLFKKIITN